MRNHYYGISLRNFSSKKILPKEFAPPKGIQVHIIKTEQYDSCGVWTKSIQLFHFASELISTEEQKAFHFQEGLRPFFQDKLFLHKLETYSEAVESALLAERSAKELQRYMEQTREVDLIILRVFKHRKGQVLHETRLSNQLTK